MKPDSIFVDALSDGEIMAIDREFPLGKCTSIDISYRELIVQRLIRALIQWHKNAG